MAQNQNVDPDLWEVEEETARKLRWATYDALLVPKSDEKDKGKNNKSIVENAKVMLPALAAMENTIRRRICPARRRSGRG